MKKTIRHCSRSSPPRGFALIVTLSVMILIIVLAVGMLTLSTVTLRSGKAESHRTTARANARLAMMQALGELQRLAGPDQRVTATASLLEPPATNATPIANRHWTGVWRTDRYKGETAPNPILHRSTTASGMDAYSLLDRRGDGSYDKTKQVLGWLVSNPDPTGELDPSVAPGGETLMLVGTGSLGPSASSSEKVSVPVVPIHQDGKRVGGYGWWIGDEGVKARLDLASGNPSQPKFKSLNATHFGISAIRSLTDFDKIPAEELPRIVSRNSAELPGDAAIPKDSVSAAFHSLTAHSGGVLADTLNGGLRRDFTALLATGSLAAYGTKPNSRPSIGSATPLIDSPNLSSISAQMGLFKGWNDLGGGMNSSREITVTAPASANGVVQYVVEKESTTPSSSSGPSIIGYKTPAIHPVIVDASMSYGLSAKRDPTNPEYYQIFLHLYPRFVLWNPYNAKLSAGNYATQIGLPTEFQPNIYKNATTTKETFYVKSGSSFSPNGQANLYDWIKQPPVQLSENNPSNPLGAPSFWIPSAAFEPGEALLFTADASSSSDLSVPWTPSGNLSGFPLSCSISGSDLAKHSFVVETNRYVRVPAGTSLSNFTYNYNWEQWPGHLTNNLFSRLWKVTNGNIRPVDLANQSTPLQYINLAEDGIYPSDIAYSVPVNLISKQRPLELLGNPGSRSPFPWLKWGQRAQWFQDTDANASPNTSLGATGPAFATPFLEHNLFTANNLRADWHVRGPADFAYRMHRGAANANYARFVHGLMIDDMLGWDWTDSSLAPASAGGKNRVSPFGRPSYFGDLTYPLFDLPQKDVPLFSLGALQHVPLSNFYWHPSYAIGNSFADQRVARNRTVNFVDSNQWSNLGYHGATDRWNKIRQNLSDQSFLYDLSYEANQALWDRYFLSTIPRSYTRGSQIPNTRLAPITADAATVPRLLDGNQAASHLMLNGAFNINSTSEDAWAAWLGSMRENSAMEVFFNDDSSTRANNVFSRLLLPQNEEYRLDDPYSQSTWSGYRKLNDDEIHELAKEIVVEVKRRGPFISLADFVNRRLVDPPKTSGSETDLSATGLKGTLQAAIDRTKVNGQLLNQQLAKSFPIDKSREYESKTGVNEQARYGSSYPDVNWNAMSGYATQVGIKPDHNHWVESKLAGSPGYLTQADLLQKLGSSISARSDTFVIRTYGESRDPDGTIRARAWAECIVQRTPDPIQPDTATNNLDPVSTGTSDFGRRFQVVSFRWLNSNEI